METFFRGIQPEIKVRVLRGKQGKIEQIWRSPRKG